MDLHALQLSFWAFIILFAFAFGKLFRRFGLGENAGQMLGAFFAGPVLVNTLARTVDLSNFDSLIGPEQAQFATENLQTFLSGGLGNISLFLPGYMILIAAAVMDEWHLQRLKENFSRIVVYSFVQMLTTFLPVALICRLMGFMNTEKAILCGLIALLTSPALVYIEMNLHQIEGRLRSLWAQVQVMTSVLAFIAACIFFSFTDDIYFAGSFDSDRIWENVFYPALGGLAAFVIINTLAKLGLFSAVDSSDKKEAYAELLAVDSVPSTAVLVLVWGTLNIVAGILLSFNMPLFIAALVAGFLLSNYHSQYIFDALKIPGLMDLFHLLFFAILGASLDANQLLRPELLFFSVVYIVVRGAGQIGGVHLAAKFLKEKREVRQALAWLFVPQCGMAVVAFMTNKSFFSVELNEILQPLLPAFILGEIAGAFIVSPVLERYRGFILQQKEEKTDQVQVVKDVQRVSVDSLIADRVITDINVHSNEDAVKMLTAELVKHGHVSELRNITALILEREKLGSTAIGDEVALPHCRTADVDFPMAVAGFVEHGESIDWDAPDGQGVRFIFMLVTPLNDPNLHIEAMKTLTTYIMRPGFLKELEQACRDNKTFEYLHALASGSLDEKDDAVQQKEKS